ncbi:MAG: Asp23/Gls24 family envelope stress response protein [Oligosphaeraceae bacterium]|nr:Asp23/Gls24 family envelope stress response protein [Oligosphaeraceae bacterium]
MSADTHDKKQLAAEASSLVVDNTVINESELGSLSISKSVIAMIVRKYTLEVEGISRFAPQRLVEGLADMISKRNYERSIQIDFEDDAVLISLTLIANFGYPLAAVVEKLQQLLKEKVEEAVGIKVKKINVFIKDLEEFDELLPAEKENLDEA